ncbi:MAG: glycosyltransferase family 4 protein [Desulfobacula sp.]|uniref:glycosyltransferase family 4 protein n=1 Tax=Desulfobacula sp. TaxID=2593537 RepID=UPI0025B963C5|nr:glycosyltransferase family 4 protein [Desulfobacula sp.]MCD4720403.1 glycosyltransferase family 4 protein [Desulfobacula sp.]
MKIFVTGTRGMPDIPGGIENHCQNIYPLIAQKGHDVYVATRKPYVKCFDKNWCGVNLVHLYAPLKSSLETIIHTFLAVLKARFHNPDILHIHAIGPSLMTPLARLLGMKVVITHHGKDYERIKWGKVARGALRLGEWMGVKWAKDIIVISPVIRDAIKRQYNRKTTMIYNGVRLKKKVKRTDYLKRLGLTPKRYILAVSRVEPEKGLDLLVQAFCRLKTDCKLIIAGYTNYETSFSRQLQDMINKHDRIVWPGYVTGEPLIQLYSHAKLFVLPSFHEGLPIALLEAMSFELPVLASDIPANKAVELPKDRYFKTGNMLDLKNRLETLINKRLSDTEKLDLRHRIEDKYNWDKIANQTIAVYEKALKGKP